MKKLFTTAVLALMILADCAARKINIYVDPGEMWMKRTPQFALWVEDDFGNYVRTLYVTKSASQKSWKFSPKSGRPESLPVWYFKSGTGASTEGRASSELDAVSGSTPKKGLFVSGDISLENGRRYVIKAEVNQSFDYNDVYTKKTSGVNGQPSVIYSADFVYDDMIPEIVLHFEGCGSPDGTDGIVHQAEQDSLTSAKLIINRIYVTLGNL